MSDATSVRVEGIRRVISQMERLGVDVKDLKGAFQRIGSRAEAHAKGEAPVLTGRLAGSVRQSKRKNSVYLYAGRKSIPYAGVIHFGWPARNITSNPFMYRTVGALGPGAVKEIERELQMLIDRRGF